jgi:hypothetical protein
MDSAKREELERKYRPQMFGDCSNCGDKDVRLLEHECDPEQVRKFWDAQTPKYEPRRDVLEHLELAIGKVFLAQGLQPTEHEKLIDALALEIEPMLGGPYAGSYSVAAGD